MIKEEFSQEDFEDCIYGIYGVVHRHIDNEAIKKYIEKKLDIIVKIVSMFIETVESKGKKQ